MPYHTTTLLSVTEDTEGAAFSVSRYASLLIVVTIGGQATCRVEGRQQGGEWKELESFSQSGELNLENYGWHQIRAVAEDMASGSAIVEMSWRMA